MCTYVVQYKYEVCALFVSLSQERKGATTVVYHAGQSRYILSTSREVEVLQRPPLTSSIAFRSVSSLLSYNFSAHDDDAYAAYVYSYIIAKVPNDRRNDRQINGQQIIMFS